MANRKAKAAFIPVSPPVQPPRQNANFKVTNNSKNAPVLYYNNTRKMAPNKSPNNYDVYNNAKGRTAFMAASWLYENKESIVKTFKDAAAGIFKFKGNKAPASNGNGSYALSKAPNPKEIRLNSNVKPNTYANDYMYAMEGLCSPLQLTSARLGLPTSSANNLNSYLLQTLLFDLQTRAQANVGFDLDIANQFSAAQLLTAFNAAIDALHCYYFYTSILSYESDPRNKNEGMINLRAQITPQILSDLTQLGRRLEDTPVPPRIVDWVRYMNGNFLSGDSQGAPLLKILYDPTVLYGPPAITFPAQALAALTAPANNTVFALIRRAVPQWRIGILYDVPALPTFDQNFLTIFANLPFSFWDGAAAVTTRTVPDADTSVSYNSFSNNLDGVAYAMAGINVTGTGMLPGIVTCPVATAGITDTRISWYKVGATAGWYFVMAYVFLIESRLESVRYPTVLSTGVTPHINGCDKCQAVNGNTTLQTARNTLDFLFDIDSMPYKGKLSNFNGSGSGKI